MNSYKIKRNILYIGESCVKFKYPIKEIISKANILIVLLKIPYNIELSSEELNNVYGVNDKCEKFWRVEDILVRFEGSDVDEDIRKARSPIYVGMWLGSNEEVVIRTFNSFEYEIDYKTGKIKREVLPSKKQRPW